MIEPDVIFVPVKDLVVLPANYTIGRDYYIETNPLPEKEIVEIAFYDELTRQLTENE